MQLRIKLFAGLSDTIGSSELQINMTEEKITVGQLKNKIADQFPTIRNIVESSFIAKNEQYAQLDEMVQEEDELALIPPVSGGQDSNSKHDDHYTLTNHPISVEEVLRKVVHPKQGAVIPFVGMTREWTKGKRTVLLEYHAYPSMALRMMEQIGEEISERWPGALCAITHRLGKVDVSEISVVIAVSSPHRKACYEASQYAIDRLKQVVPIWKKEIWEDGSEWIGAQSGSWNPTTSLPPEHGGNPYER